ncbi:hypothetical protein [Azotosporobacter soli]|uniref:hypothetical protein n=1 Tax=Azotosporobacter soli TaxID=3055040 RepID=UPI0031FF1852
MDVTVCEKEKTQQTIDLFCRQSRIPSFGVKRIFHSKNVRLVSALADVRDEFDEIHLEGMIHIAESKSGAPVVRRKVHGIVAQMLEKRFGYDVKDVFIKMVKKESGYKLYCVTRFKEAFSTARSNGQAQSEDALASGFARQMKELLGRGPKWCRVVAFEEKLLLFEIEGFFSLGEQQRFAEENACSCGCLVERLARQNLRQIITSLMSDYEVAAYIPVWDIVNNKAVVIVTTLKPIPF